LEEVSLFAWEDIYANILALYKLLPHAACI